MVHRPEELTENYSDIAQRILSWASLQTGTAGDLISQYLNHPDVRVVRLAQSALDAIQLGSSCPRKCSGNTGQRMLPKGRVRRPSAARIQVEVDDTPLGEINLQEIRRYEVLSPAKERRVFELYNEASSEELREYYFSWIVEANLRLVAHVAKSYPGKHFGMDDSDIRSYGQMGLIKAIEKFDPSRGYKFSTYATAWIKQSITRALSDYSGLIRIPVHKDEVLRKIRRIIRERDLDTTRDKDVELIGVALGLQSDCLLNDLDLLFVMEPLSEEGMPPCDLCSSGDCWDDEHGFYAPYDCNHEEFDCGLFSSEARISGFIEPVINVPSTQANPSLESMAEAVSVDLDKALSILTEREREVIRLRFGLIDGRYRTLEQVGALQGVTRERIRQIEKKATQKLSNLPGFRGMRDYISLYQ